MECPLGYKDLLVVGAGAPQTRRRIELAVTLAARFDSHLVGVYVTLAPESSRRRSRFAPMIFDPLYSEAEEKAHTDAEATRNLFEDMAHRQGISAEWRATWGYPS